MGKRRGGAWVFGVVVFAGLFCGTAANGVEGAGSYRGSGFVLPHFRNTNQVVTFVRIVNAFRRLESPVTDNTVAPPYDTSNIFVHIQYLQRCADFNRGCDIRGQCLEFDRQIPLTTNDYVLVDVSDVNRYGAPKEFDEGYIVAVAWYSANGTPSGKILHNHLLADEVTVDVLNGRTWGINATTFRAVHGGTAGLGTFPGPGPNPNLPGEESPVRKRMWHEMRGDLQDFAILGRIGTGDPPGAGLVGTDKYERIRYPQDHFLTVLSKQANFGGIRPDDTEAIIVPISYIPPQDFDGDGTAGDPEPFEQGNRSVWNPEKLPSAGNYVNQYVFNVRIFDNDENLLSTRRHTVRCYARMTAQELSNNVTDQAAFRGRPGLEAWQGWFHIESEGFGTLPGLENTLQYRYFNRALIAQVDGLTRLPGNDNSWWGLWPAHDRTTCEHDSLVAPRAFPYSLADINDANDTDPDYVNFCP